MAPALGHTFIAALLSLGSGALAQVVRTCPESNVCYSLNIPASTASSGNGDIFFQISAPTSYQWVGLGQGSGMAGSNIFVMYTSASGQNVTVSPRLGVGHVEPEHDTAAQITLLEGTGVSNGMMTANVRCSNCNSWSGGQMNFQSSSVDWIHATKSGSPLNSDDTSADIQMHDNAAPFSWNIADAKGGDSQNPFVTAAATGNTPSTNANTTTTTSSTTSSSSSKSNTDQIRTAHGAIAATAFVALFPGGGILIRVASFSGVVWAHAALQVFAYVFFIAAVGLGIYLGQNLNLLSNHHPIIGLVLFVILFFQPLSGWMHHKMFKKHSGRTWWSYEHLGIGRIAIVLGIINGGLGLQLAQSPRSYSIAYGVCAGIAGVTYIAAIVYGELKRRKNVSSSFSDSQEYHGKEDGRREETI